MKWVLIMFMASSNDYRAGNAGLDVGFESQRQCELAGKSLAKQAHERGGKVLTWGCFER